jgi:hypothetical protein
MGAAGAIHLRPRKEWRSLVTGLGGDLIWCACGLAFQPYAPTLSARCMRNNIRRGVKEGRLRFSGTAAVPRATSIVCMNIWHCLLLLPF